MLPEMIGGLSPFDQIARLDDAGEHWTGRDLMQVMTYQNWEDFRRIVMRAFQSAKNSGHDAEQAFSVIAEKGTGGRPREDFRLTRFAAYLVAMNGDPNKPEVAAAQAYFAIKTREAEAAQSLSEIDVARKYVAALEAKQALMERVAILAPKADAWDVLASAKGDYSVREAANILNRDPAIQTGQNRLFQKLRDLKLIDRNDIPYAAHSRHVVLRTRYWRDPDGVEQTDGQVRITADGLRYLRKRLGASLALVGLEVAA